jgi:hypothetical protein
MSKRDDPALYESGFDRIAKDRYWTHPWLVSALLELVDIPGPIWEPAAGRGDMVRALQDFGHEVIASDLDLSEFDTGMCSWFGPVSFLEASCPQARAIVTNPPYDQPKGIADKFVRHALDLLAIGDIDFVAMLMRAEFCRGKRRIDMFGECPFYHGEIVLTTRPLWDWWFRDQPEASPRHNFSWFIWCANQAGPPTQMFHYRKKK